MARRIYVVRHCEAEGQPREARLTNKGVQQAAELAEFFSKIKINRIVSSPFVRAIHSVNPLAELKQIEVETDERLSERILSTKVLEDWLEKLQATYNNLDLKFDGGESTRVAMARVVSVVEEVLKGEAENTLIVTHGNLMSLLLKNYQSDFGFEQWKNLSNPDVFLLEFEEKEVRLKRVWQK
ncbi:histidine phosphatase family protein [Neobacillus sp. PS2-9]|uniref:histidine phosphatase family protein n=1 Tax=Neobacillus sp. PS2-9 TaxID=3070676 RepID=UPI0027E0CE90|nr:histidine phosphatase family protein [Neobacillus sp. PS2-9]WML57942.1 histidine phosphatase family protein [Neobacillus sp. PS2-9]